MNIKRLSANFFFLSALIFCSSCASRNVVSNGLEKADEKTTAVTEAGKNEKKDEELQELDVLFGNDKIIDGKWSWVTKSVGKQIESGEFQLIQDAQGKISGTSISYGNGHQFSGKVEGEKRSDGLRKLFVKNSKGESIEYFGSFSKDGNTLSGGCRKKEFIGNKKMVTLSYDWEATRMKEGSAGNNAQQKVNEEKKSEKVVIEDGRRMKDEIVRKNEEEVREDNGQQIEDRTEETREMVGKQKKGVVATYWSWEIKNSKTLMGRKGIFKRFDNDGQIMNVEGLFLEPLFSAFKFLVEGEYNDNFSFMTKSQEQEDLTVDAHSKKEEGILKGVDGVIKRKPKDSDQIIEYEWNISLIERKNE